MFVLAKKNKRYAFKALGNGEQDNPAVCVFSRFPQKKELFLKGGMESVFDDISLNLDIDKIKNDKEKIEKEIIREVGDKYVKTFMKNWEAQEVDYKKFAQECIEKFENFTLDDGMKIETAGDLLSLPSDYAQGVELILDECYRYAQSKEEFTAKN